MRLLLWVGRFRPWRLRVLRELILVPPDPAFGQTELAVPPFLQEMYADQRESTRFAGLPFVHLINDLGVRK